MKLIMKLIFQYIILFFFGLISFSTIAEEKNLDELIKETKLKVYSQPLEVLRVGDSLYNNKSTNLEEKIAGLLLIGDGLLSVRNYSQVLEYLNIAKDLLKNENYLDGEVKVLSRLGYVYFQLDLYDEALNYLKQAEEKNFLKNKNFYMNKGYIIGVKGMIYRNLISCEMGLKYFERSKNAFLASDEELSRINLSIINYNMANCFLNLNDFEAAEEGFQKAYDAANIIKQDRNSLKLFAEKGVANLYNAKKEYREANKILKRIYKDAEAIDDKSLLRSVLSDMTSNYLALEDWKAFKIYSEEIKSLNKEIIQIKKEATIIALQGIDKSQSSLIDQKIEKYKIQIIITLLGFLFLFAFLGWKIYKRRQEVKSFQAEIFQY
ncbi:MAG TPA: hypothetical protein VK021_10880 [Flavobacteriaceae bacterium]|nr:hypothetical protein [Flavobacteriaceae bacterium]